MPDYYRTHAQEYFEATRGIDPRPFLAPLAEFLAPGAEILDIGCGSGRDLAWLKQKGFSPTGFERSAELARLARAHSACPVIEGDFDTFDFTVSRFDAVLLIGSLVHLPPEQLPLALRRAAGALRPGGVILLSLKEGDGTLPMEDGRVFTLWRHAPLAALFESLELKILHHGRQVSRLRPTDFWLGYLLRQGEKD